MNLKACWLLSQATGKHTVPHCRGKIINFCSLLTYRLELVVFPSSCAVPQFVRCLLQAKFSLFSFPV
ncbi:unnamed protein product [Somion occarium]|uniref:Uncharacterized protein n=1 Tax=Somion occarium TaxID=3059160 RepID=A0ABP1CX87_9APHY